MYTLPRTSRSGFTLIELMISMSIFAVMSVIIMSVYIQTTNTARKMNATRELSETAREITERIAQDVRDKGITIGTEFDPSPSAYILWTDQASYTSSGSEYMSIT
jgi:prepilin-type N-terminal cleavage/methylation domain-containing protein